MVKVLRSHHPPFVPLSPQDAPGRMRRIRVYLPGNRHRVVARLKWLVFLFVLVPQLAFSQFRLHEVLYDGAGTDADDAFTEIVGAPGSSLDGWRLVGVNGSNGEVYRDLALTGVVVPADSVVVIATSSAAGAVLEARDFTANVDWQNGPDAVQLRDSTDNVVDALQYGDAGEFNAGEGTPAVTASAGKSLSRDRSSSDTDDNLADFARLDTPTPGSLNGNELKLAIPDTTTAYDDTLVVPLRLSGTTGKGILAAEVFLSYDGDLLTADSALATPMSDGWTVLFNRVEGAVGPVDTLRIAMAADDDTLQGDGDLVRVHFRASDQRRPAATSLKLEHALFNDGSIAPILQDGQVAITGTDAALSVSPTPVDPPDDLDFELVDVDEDRSALIPDTLQIGIHGDRQVEVLAAIETGVSTGVFRGSIPVILGSALYNSGILETIPGEALTFCHDDSLTADGQSLETCVTATVAAHDARLTTTAVAEPGDTLRIQLIDDDLNTDPATVESLALLAINTATPDTERVTLAETAADDSVFFALLPTSRSAPESGDSLISMAGGDSISFTYEDEHRTSGVAATVGHTGLVVDLFGDADRNGELQAFDAATVLAHVLTPSLTGLDSLAANVDSAAPGGAITPFDAALILQHRVGMRKRFPVQESDSRNHPHLDAAAPAARPLVKQSIFEPRIEDGYVAIWTDDRSQIISGEVSIAGVIGEVQAAVDLSHFLTAFRPFDGGVRIVMAGASPVPGPGELLRIYPSAPVTAVSIVGGSFNDGQIVMPPARDPPSPTPSSFALHANYPNPFNPETTIGFDLPEIRDVRLEIFDVAGGRQRVLLAGRMERGRHLVTWDGRDDGGRRMSSGVYFYRLRAGMEAQARRMVLLK